MSTFFTSDLHFGHKKLCENLRHMSIEENDRLIISNWNKVINKRDLVFILGDITMEKPKLIEGYMQQLNGIKYVIGGNHDGRQCCIELSRIGIPVVGALKYKEFMLTHIPISQNQFLNFRGNIHGHIHNDGKENLLDPTFYYNVNTEFHNYTPVSLDTIRDYFNSIKPTPGVAIK